jgi:hypothetical protein
MPFNDEILRIYHNVVKSAVEEKGLTCKKADDFTTNEVIIQDIWNSICGSLFVIADLTDLNPNVMYELGMAHTIGKKTIIIFQKNKNAKFPFDISHIRRLEYEDSNEGRGNLLKKLSETIAYVMKQITKSDTTTQYQREGLARPWLYPLDTYHHFLLFVNRRVGSSPGLDVRIRKGFKNESNFPVNSVDIYTTLSRNKITNLKSFASHQRQTAIFPGRTFQVVDAHFFDDLTLSDDARPRLSYWIYLSVLLEYKYGVGEIINQGSYRGIFSIDRFSNRIDLREYEEYYPILFNLDESVE